jgi:hypothetical protein
MACRNRSRTVSALLLLLACMPRMSLEWPSINPWMTTPHLIRPVMGTGNDKYGFRQQTPKHTMLTIMMPLAQVLCIYAEQLVFV